MKRYARNRFLVIILLAFFIFLICCLYQLQNVLNFDGDILEKSESEIVVVVSENNKSLSKDSLHYFTHREGCYTSVSDYGIIHIPAAEVSAQIYEDFDVGDKVRVYYLFDGNCSPVPLSSLDNVLTVKEIFNER